VLGRRGSEGFSYKLQVTSYKSRCAAELWRAGTRVITNADWALGTGWGLIPAGIAYLGGMEGIEAASRQFSYKLQVTSYKSRCAAEWWRAGARIITNAGWALGTGWGLVPAGIAYLGGMEGVGCRG